MAPPGQRPAITFMNKVAADGRSYVATGNQAGKIFLWAAQPSVAFNRALAIPPNLIVTAPNLIDARSGSFSGMREEPASGLKISSPGQRAARNRPFCTGIWDVGRTELSKKAGKQNTWVLGFSNASALMALPSDAGTITMHAATNQVSFTCAAESSTTLYLGSSRGSVSMFMITDPVNHWKVLLPPAPDRAITAIVYVPLTRGIWVGDSKGEIHVINSATNKVATKFRLIFDGQPQHDAVQAMSVLGDRIWLSTSTGGLYLIDIASHTLLHRMERGVPATCFCPIDSTFLVLGAADGQAEIWKLETFERCGQFSAHTAAIRNIVTTRSGTDQQTTVLWICSEDGSISIWEVSKLIDSLPYPLSASLSDPIRDSDGISPTRLSLHTLTRRPSVACFEETGILAALE